MQARREMEREKRRRVREADVNWRVGTADANTEVDYDLKEELERKANQVRS